MLQTIARGRPSPVWRRYISAPNSTAGGFVTIPAPTGRVWQVLSLACQVIPSGVAGNRDVILAHQDGDGNILEAWPNTAAITAGQGRTFSWQAGLGAILVGAVPVIAIPMAPAVYVTPGESLLIAGTTDAGDQILNVRGVVIETNNGDTAHDDALEQRIRDHWNALHELIGTGV